MKNDEFNYVKINNETNRNKISEFGSGNQQEYTFDVEIVDYNKDELNDRSTVNDSSKEEDKKKETKENKQNQNKTDVVEKAANASSSVASSVASVAATAASASIVVIGAVAGVTLIEPEPQEFISFLSSEVSQQDFFCSFSMPSSLLSFNGREEGSDVPVYRFVTATLKNGEGFYEKVNIEEYEEYSEETYIYYLSFSELEAGTSYSLNIDIDQEVYQDNDYISTLYMNLAQRTFTTLGERVPDDPDDPDEPTSGDVLGNILSIETGTTDISFSVDLSYHAFTKKIGSVENYYESGLYDIWVIVEKDEPVADRSLSGFTRYETSYYYRTSSSISNLESNTEYTLYLYTSQYPDTPIDQQSFTTLRPQIEPNFEFGEITSGLTNISFSFTVSSEYLDFNPDYPGVAMDYFDIIVEDENYTYNVYFESLTLSDVDTVVGVVNVPNLPSETSFTVTVKYTIDGKTDVLGTTLASTTSPEFYQAVVKNRVSFSAREVGVTLFYSDSDQPAKQKFKNFYINFYDVNDNKLTGSSLDSATYEQPIYITGSVSFQDIVKYEITADLYGRTTTVLQTDSITFSDSDEGVVYGVDYPSGVFVSNTDGSVTFPIKVVYEDGERYPFDNLDFRLIYEDQSSSTGTEVTFSKSLILTTGWQYVTFESSGGTSFNSCLGEAMTLEIVTYVNSNEKVLYSKTTSFYSSTINEVSGGKVESTSVTNSDTTIPLTFYYVTYGSSINGTVILADTNSQETFTYSVLLSAWPSADTVSIDLSNPVTSPTGTTFDTFEHIAEAYANRTFNVSISYIEDNFMSETVVTPICENIIFTFSTGI